MHYMNYNKKVIFSQFLGYITWTSLTTFMLVSKNSLGIDNIPIFESLIFIASLIGIRLAHVEALKFSTSILIDIILETIFLIGIYYTLFIGDLALAAICVYIIIILNNITNTITDESARRYEDRYLKDGSDKNELNIIRTKKKYINTLGGAIGTILAVIILSYFKIDLITFTKLMLVLNIVRNMYDYYIWKKYL